MVEVVCALYDLATSEGKSFRDYVGEEVTSSLLEVAPRVRILSIHLVLVHLIITNSLTSYDCVVMVEHSFSCRKLVYSGEQLER